MAIDCPLTGEKALYLDCKECDDKKDCREGKLCPSGKAPSPLSVEKKEEAKGENV